MNSASITKAFTAPPLGMNKRHHLEYNGIYLAALCGIILNIAFIILFLIAYVSVLVWFSVLGIVFWLSCILLARRGKFQYAIAVGIFEMMLHVTIAVSVLGTGYGLQMILWSTMTFTTLKAGQKPWVNYMTGTAVVLQFILLYLFVPEFTDVRPFKGYEDVFFAVTSILSASSLMFVILRMKSIHIRQRKTLNKQIYNDDLTKLYNRNFLYEVLEYELDFMKQARNPFCVCFADIDFFKKVNDTYGHQVGDEVLVEVAKILTNSLRKSDVVCRWGGEEFVMVLPRCDIEMAPIVVEKIRHSLHSNKLSSQQLTITMSFGIVELSHDHSLDEIFKQADTLLYQAKNNGRDRIEVAV
jgi:diguanylate cyclase (GGDEF)-like protein